MRVFVLGTGRCGTMTLSKAFGHATNYTCSHEGRAHLFEGRLDYPDWHIEVDNRLSWFLGSLRRLYPDARYVHLTRNKADVVKSMVSRPVGHASLLEAFGNGIVRSSQSDREAAASLLYDTVHDNIACFGRHTPVLTIRLEAIREQFPSAWRWVGAEGDLDAAMAELDVRHNAWETKP